MAKIIKNYKKIVIFFGFIFLMSLSFYFLITQPLFFDYDFDKNLVLTKIDLVDEGMLKKHVKFLSESDRVSENGQKSVAKYILDELKNSSIDEKNISVQNYVVNGATYRNIIVNFESDDSPANKKKYIIGAHYDTHNELPGADDNASAVAGLLEIARNLNEEKYIFEKNIELVFYATEELPFFRTENMGSFQHAKNIKNKEDTELVIALEMIGYYSDEENSQDFPVSFLKYFYPTKGNFIAIVSDFSNSMKTREMKKKMTAFLNKNKLIEAYSINAPAIIPGIDFSDHRNYWKFDIPSVMITDTAFYRNKNYHTKNDTYDKLNYAKMKEVVSAVIFSVVQSKELHQGD